MSAEATIGVGEHQVRIRAAQDSEGIWYAQVEGVGCNLKGEEPGVYYPTAIAGVGEWCPVCKTTHVDPGARTDAGKLTRQCPAIPADDPRNQFENYP